MSKLIAVARYGSACYDLESWCSSAEAAELRLPPQKKKIPHSRELSALGNHCFGIRSQVLRDSLCRLSAHLHPPPAPIAAVHFPQLEGLMKMGVIVGSVRERRPVDLLIIWVRARCSGASSPPHRAPAARSSSSYGDQQTHTQQARPPAAKHHPSHALARNQIII